MSIITVISLFSTMLLPITVMAEEAKSEELNKKETTVLPENETTMETFAESLRNNEQVSSEETNITNKPDEISKTEVTEQEQEENNIVKTSPEKTEISTLEASTYTNSNGWEYTDKGTYCVITTYSGTEEDLTVPNEINGKPTKITKDTFKNFGLSIKSVTIQAGRFGKVGVEGSSLAYLLSGRDSLKSVDLSGLDTSNVTNMSNMFEGNKNLTSLNLNGLNTSNVTQMNSMFRSCGQLLTLDLSSFNTSNVENMSYMFFGLGSIKTLDLSNFNTSKVKNMSCMFEQVSNITDLDLSNFDMRNVVTMARMFSGMSMLQTINLSSFNTTQQVRDMSNMFTYCASLTNLDMSNFDTSNVENMNYMFQDCNKIKKLDLRNFDTSKVTSMDGMFLRCYSLIEVNVSNFNTRNVISMTRMFENTRSLQVIDLSSFEISASVSQKKFGLFRLVDDKYQPIVKPLTVIAKDPFFFDYQYDTDERKVNSILLNANGGTFSDGSVEKNYFTSCAIRPEETTLDKLEEFKQNNLPTKKGFFFNGYTTTTDTSQATSVLDLIGTVYDAQWKTRTVSLEVPTTISFGTHKLSKGTNYYSVDTVEGTSLSITDDRGIGSKWQLTAKLQTPFTNNGKILSNSLVYKTSTGEETITENAAQVIATHTTSTDSEKTVVSDNWTNTQGLMLKLEEGKAYAGEYSGTIEWTLNDTP